MTIRLLALLALFWSALACSAPRPPPAPVAVAASPYTAGIWSIDALTGSDGGAVSCADGTQAYIAVNPSTAPSGCLGLIMIGQGVCWTYGGRSTCPPAGNQFSYSTPHADTRDYTTSAGGLLESRKGALVTGILDTSVSGPLSGCDLVAIPSCTSDALIGDADATYGSTTWRHRGKILLSAALTAASSLYPSPTEVRVYGMSSGGMAALLSASQIASTWTGVNVSAVVDSGTLLSPARWTTQAAALTAWGATLPGGCSDFQCAAATAASFYTRLGVMGSIHDAVLSVVFSTSGNETLACMSLCGGPCRCDYGDYVVSPSTEPGVQEYMSAMVASGSNVYRFLSDDTGPPLNADTKHVIGTGRTTQPDAGAGGPLADESCTVPAWVGGVYSGSFASPCTGSVL